MMRSNETIQLARDRQQEHLQAVVDIEVQRRLRALGRTPGTANKKLLPRLAAGVLICILFLLSAGCTSAFVMAANNPSDSAAATALEDPFVITSANLVATWRIYDYGYTSFLRLNSDHTFQRSHTADMPADKIVDFGKWRFDDGLLMLSSDEAVANCSGKPDGQYRLWTRPYDGVYFFRQDEKCEGRLGFGWEPDYAPIQLNGKLCRVDSIAFCDSFIGYEPKDVVQPNAPRMEDKVVAPSAAIEGAVGRVPGVSEVGQPDSKEGSSISDDVPTATGNFFLQD